MTETSFLAADFPDNISVLKIKFLKGLIINKSESGQFTRIRRQAFLFSGTFDTKRTQRLNEFCFRLSA